MKPEKTQDPHTTEKRNRNIAKRRTPNINLERRNSRQQQTGRITTLEEKKLFDILFKRQNFLLLEDERPTSQFLKLE